MQLSRQKTQEIIDAGKMQGLNGQDVLNSLIKKGFQVEGVEAPRPTAQKPTFTETIKEAGQDFVGIGKDILKSSQQRADNIAETQQAFKTGEQGLARSTFQTAGQLAGAGSDAIGATMKGLANLFLSEQREKNITEDIGTFINKQIQRPEIQQIMAKYDSLSDAQKRDIEAGAGIASLITDVGLGGAAQSVTRPTKTAVASTARNVLTETADTGIDLFKKTAGEVPTSKNSFIAFVSPEIDDSVKNVLKNTPTEKFDEFVQIATQAADPKNPSVYEKVADTLSDSAKQIDSQTKALNTQKKEILAKAKTGLKEFTKETNQTILELNKVKDSPLAKDFISRLKSVKNKIDADKVIDDLQDMLYTGNRNMTLATGSKEDKILKGILGRYNTKLKDSLPQSYRNINTKISENLNGLNVLNTALGEVVEGVPTRGAGLVKQFFSPAGSKAKELFAFIKQRTGNDIANDAVLAKYIGSAFGDVKVNSLLEGIPSTKSGIIDALTEFTFEKIGAGSALRKAKTEGMIKKARDITLPNK